MDYLHFVFIQVTDLFQKHVSFDERNLLNRETLKSFTGKVNDSEQN
jgi:hypothetical protein